MEFLVTILPFVAIFGLMYFMMIRPQKKAAEKTQNMLDALKVGDSVVTIGGLHGVIDEVNDADKTVIIDCDGIFLTFERRAIARIIEVAAEPPVSSDENVIVETEEPDDSEES